MSGEPKSIQLQQKIIHLKSELDKYKTLFASLASSEEWLHLHEQMDQLRTENNELATKCRHYEEALSRQTNEMGRLSEALERMRQENESLHEEIEQFKVEYAYWKEQAELKEEHIESLGKEVDVFKQKQAEWDKERGKMEEEKRLLEHELSVHRSFINEYISFQSTLDSLTSWNERIGTMEKDYSVLKKHTDRILKDVEELKKILAAHQPETDKLKEEVRILTDKLHAVEEKLSQMEQERQKDLLILQKHILNQQVELESIVEKTSRCSTEVEHLSNQIADLIKTWSDQIHEHSHGDMSELKNMLSQIIQLLAAKHVPPSEAHQTSSIALVNSSPEKKQTEKSSSSLNSFLKLQEFMDDTKQPIVISPVKTKESHTFNTSTTHRYPQKSIPARHVRTENPSYHHRHPSQHQSSLGEDEDRSPNAVPSTLETDTQREYVSDHSITEHSKDASPSVEAKPEWINGNQALLSGPAQIEPPLDEASPLENPNRTTKTPTNQEPLKARHQKEKCESHQESHESLVLPNDQAAFMKMENKSTTPHISVFSNEHGGLHADTHNEITLALPPAFAHSSSSSMERENQDETMTQTEEVLATEDGKNQKWSLFSLLKKTKILQ
ncbi:hypothetical protein [Geobacillus vulcani]|uniref:hypothetical protein n=1 Tax=Geobacillus vulcani TaxID=135517 RepID=UPI0004DF9AC2|nr:hypothetical protein [Geobacillus vulcani]